MIDTIGDVVLLTVLASPAAALAVWLLARRRGTWRTSLAEVAMVYGTVPWVWMILLPNGAATTDRDPRVNLVPLRDLADVLAAGPLTATVQIVANLLVFASLGFFAPVRFAALASAWRMLALGAGLSILVETLQFTLRLDRVSSVDDVLLNAAGAGLAALASRRWWSSPVAVTSRPAAFATLEDAAA
ncbi:VanZ family protein [Actinoplanes rectilineatus]|uniref:VanZ family protein n=1 Tax=Actinoplanes rectilineatus TaxID=113571 RepID=UPI0005F2910E|nr:VanZ family protein [Actinoplanes rectilineatus]